MKKTWSKDNVSKITDIEKAKDAIIEDITLYIQLSDKIKQSYELSLFVVKQDGLFIRFIPEHFKDNKEIALIAVAKNYFAIMEISDRLKEDLDVIKTAINKDTRVLKKIASKYRDNKELALISLSSNSPEMKLYSQEILDIIGDGSLDDKTHRLIRAISSENLAKNLSLSLDYKIDGKKSKI